MEDRLYKFLKYYNRLPLWIRNVIGKVYRVVPPAWRYGRFFNDYARRIHAFESLGNEQAERLHEQLLLANVNAAIREIPFYRDFGLLKTIEDFYKIPVVAKNNYVERLRDFCSPNCCEERIEANTGGSNGTPMKFYIHRNRTRPKEAMHFQWFWGQWGWRPGARMLMLRGKSLRGNALFEHQEIKNCLNVSCYELSPENVSEVMAEVEKFNPEFIHAYPSALKIFMKCIQGRAGCDWTRVRAIFLGSEYLPEQERQAMEAFFGAKVCSWYGHSECAIHGGYHPENQEFYFFPFYGHVELLDDQGAPVRNIGDCGRIVATSFDNGVMPFIRYDTGDRGVFAGIKSYGNFQCLVLSRIEGRDRDFIICADGRLVSVTAFIFGQHLPVFEKVLEMQLEQNVIGELLIRIVQYVPFSSSDIDGLREFLEESVSRQLKVKIEFVDRIAKTHRGKHRFLIQNVRTV